MKVFLNHRFIAGLLGVLFLCVYVLMGCASVGLAERKCNQVPEGQTSQLCLIFGGYVEEADLAVRLANVAALEQDIYSATIALRVVDDIKTEVEKGITYATFAHLVIKRVSGRIGIVVAQEMDRLVGIELLVSEFDKTLLLDHLNKQRMLILAGASEAIQLEMNK